MADKIIPCLWYDLGQAKKAAFEAMMTMKKIDIAALEAAADKAG